MSIWHASGQDALFLDAFALVESVKCRDMAEARTRCNSLTERARAVGDQAIEQAASSMACALHDFAPTNSIDCSYELADLMYEICSVSLITEKMRSSSQRHPIKE